MKISIYLAVSTEKLTVTTIFHLCTHQLPYLYWQSPHSQTHYNYNLNLIDPAQLQLFSPLP
jgi:hypothetical protein